MDMKLPDRLLPEFVKPPIYKVYEGRLTQKLDRDHLPQHIGVILDGHRRYAKAEGYEDFTRSYRAGMRKFETFLEWASVLELEAITAWVLSTENLNRPPEELAPYFQVLIDLFERLPMTAGECGYSVRFIGSLDLLPTDLTNAAKRVTELTAGRDRVLNIAMGYGGRQEIVDAVADLVDTLYGEGVAPAKMSEHISAAAIGNHMYAPDVPDPDLVIRTSGESRLSGFLLWQSAYSEFSFVDVYWPAFRRVDFLRAMRDYSRSERRFGK